MTDDDARAQEKVRALLSQGVTPREIALRLEISTQRVYVLMKNLRKEVQPENETA